MPQPLSDYFAREAGEFLDQLQGLLASDSPDPVQFFRLARGVRGSAQIAGAPQVARVAERLEDGARALRDGQLRWSGDVAERARRTVEDLAALVRAHASGGDEPRARSAEERWSDVSAVHRRADAAQPPDQLIAFVRREIGGVVGEMERVLGELARDPSDAEALRPVLRRMRPVRGVAGLDSLSAVLELLEGVEDAGHEVLSRSGGVRPADLALLSAARDALRAAGRALERGGSPGDTPEMEGYRALRDGGEDEAEDPDVIPISRLFHDDGGPHVVASPKAPVPGDGGLPESVESFLRIEATGFLDRAEGLIASARSHRFGRVARQLAELASSVHDLAGTYGLDVLARAGREASEALRSATSADQARQALRALRAAIPGAAPAEEPPSPVAAAEAPAEAAPEPGGEEGVVPIETLLYEPEAALREALALRERIETLVQDRRGPLGSALDELFGLVELGLERRAS
jgi:chemotaxis protein histidine kinase CheA